MSGLVGSWDRIHEERKTRAYHQAQNQWRRGMPDRSDRMNGVQWLVQIAIPKRHCRVHGVKDRCHAKNRKIPYATSHK